MSIVAGIDFGTLSVRVSIFDATRGRLGSGTAEYPLHRRKEDPDHATQSHQDHLKALKVAMTKAIAQAGVAGTDIEALAIDTTGSSVVPVNARLEPIDDYYLWCDHRSWQEAAAITHVGRERKEEALDWSGGAYSSEWGLAKVLHWLRHNPQRRAEFHSALEHCDLIAAILCGIDNVQHAPRSICAMGHKWMWNQRWGGLPNQEYLQQVDPLLAEVREKIVGRFGTSDQIAGNLSAQWAAELGLRAGIPIPIGALDAHWDAVAAGIRVGDVVSVIGTSTCIMAISDSEQLVPGVCGVVPGSIHPQKLGIEAGLSAVGDIFDAIATRAGSTVGELSQGLENFKPGQTGLLRLAWDNGDRTVLVNPELGGVTLGWKLTHTAQDELFAAIEGTAMHTRVILERMQKYGVPIERVVHGGGIPQKNSVLNQVYANVLNKPVLVPAEDTTSLGSAIFAFLAAKTYKRVDEAQAFLCPGYRVFDPQPEAVAIYQQLFPVFEKLYFELGTRDAAWGKVLPTLREVAARQQG
jgi:L-ribulokinase